MQCYLYSDNNEIEITRNSSKFKDIHFTPNLLQQTVEFQTSSECIILNGFALYPHSKYTLTSNDILIIDKMTYRLKFVNQLKTSKTDVVPVKKLKTDSSTKITSFFKDVSCAKSTIDTPFNKIVGTWEEITDLMIFKPQESISSTKIASFDLDGTLIKPKSAKKYPENHMDWMLLYKSIPQLLLEYYDKGFKLVLFSNQLPLGNDKTKRNEFKQKIEDILNKIKLPMQAFIATKRNINRKPCIGMWQALSEQNSDEINKAESFYVGDAAGRPKSGNTPKDHSFADLLFAKNVGIKFYTPEEFFLNAKHVPVTISFEPRVNITQTKFNLGKQTEIIVMVGAPASGKSSFCKKELVPKGYTYVNRDTLGSWQKCISVATNALQDKKLVVIDNTNKDKESRKRYMDLAKKFHVPCRCFYMKVDKLRAMHNNKYRELVTTSEKHVPVTDIIIHSHYKGFECPTLQEGFDEIVELNFVPSFSDADYKNRELYEMHLLEKY